MSTSHVEPAAHTSWQLPEEQLTTHEAPVGHEVLQKPEEHPTVHVSTSGHTVSQRPSEQFTLQGLLSHVAAHAERAQSQLPPAQVIGGRVPPSASGSSTGGPEGPQRVRQ